MKTIKVLGTGCANCKATLKMIEEQARAKGVEIELDKVEDIAEIMAYGVMSTPGVVIDGKVVHAGGVPSRDSIDGWLTGNGGGCCSGGSTGGSGSVKCCG